MSDLTTEDLVVQCRQVAESKAQAMGNAGAGERAALYVGLKFEVQTSSSFACGDPGSGGSLELLDTVLDTVEEMHPIEFNVHRDGDGRQTVYWRYV